MPRVISNIILSTMDDCRESLLKISSFERELWKRLMAIKLSIMKNCKLEDDRSKRVFFNLLTIILSHSLSEFLKGNYRKGNDN